MNLKLVLLEYFFIDVIQGHCSVYDFNEYETNLDTKEERVFFTRSEFNIKNQKLAPHPNEW